MTPFTENKAWTVERRGDLSPPQPRTAHNARNIRSLSEMAGIGTHAKARNRVEDNPHNSKMPVHHGEQVGAPWRCLRGRRSGHHGCRVRRAWRVSLTGGSYRHTKVGTYTKVEQLGIRVHMCVCMCVYIYIYCLYT